MMNTMTGVFRNKDATLQKLQQWVRFNPVLDHRTGTLAVHLLPYTKESQLLMNDLFGTMLNIEYYLLLAKGLISSHLLNLLVTRSFFFNWHYSDSLEIRNFYQKSHFKLYSNFAQILISSLPQKQLKEAKSAQYIVLSMVAKESS